ncbi:hypothetical protein TcasGA2_TC012317 [Tribolium castaneum]|uniref:Uncharacterized protein n=1 Tax=Tribolium castaneum TaxID=7070 RepID=D6X114_TRICA|nr:hypothetical protein TcasGA2_TC012317 [Tribolium castaneum]
MLPIRPNLRQLKLPVILTKRFVDIFNTVLRQKHSPRGPLPWECGTRCAEKPSKKFQKKEVKTVQEKTCPNQCAVLQRPKRNTYEWVINEDEKPCGPFGLRKVVEKTICEIRRFQKCMKLFNNEAKCQNLAPPACTRITKTYPMLEAVHKGSLPGCAIPIPASATKKTE